MEERHESTPGYAPDDSPASYRYWAFLSYSRRDDRWVRSLHRQLESFRVPREVATPADLERRIRPVFRDREELAVSADLTAELTRAIDRSRFVVLVASTASAASSYVNAELRYLVDQGRGKDLLVVALDSQPDGSVPLPAVLREMPSEPLWLDARNAKRPRRIHLVRLVAGLLGVSFDALWRRDRRRRRRDFAAALAGLLLVVAIATTVVIQQRVADQADRPERQVAAFDAFFRRHLLGSGQGVTAKDLNFRILRTDDLNNDGLLDFIVFNQTAGWCGSAGCGTDVYLTEDIGSRYQKVADLFSTSSPRTRATNGPFLDIVSTDYTVDAEPIYTVRKWRGKEYEVDHYEYCAGVLFEYCTDPVLITPVSGRQVSRMRDTVTRLYVEPDASAPSPRTIADPPPLRYESIIGALDHGRWVLVDYRKSRSGFARQVDLDAR